MFGSSNLFGQSSNSSPFGTQTQPMFGQSNSASSNNPFAPKPFGTTSTPFGAQTGSSIFGGTSTGVFGAPQTSSPFGASSIASSAPAFGSSNSPFGGTSTFGQKSFGFSTPQSSPFGSTTQQSQPAFGNSTFGASSTPAFGASSTPAFGASTTPAFGASNTSPFGGSNTSPFGASNTSPFGASNTSAFGANSTTPGFAANSTTPGFAANSTTPGFGANSTPGFGANSTPGFGANSTPGFGANSTPGFGANSTPGFGASSTPTFGSTNTPSFGASSTPSFGVSPAPAFGSSGTTFGNNAFGSGGAFGASSTPAFGASSTPSFSFGSSPAFGSTQSPFGAQGAQASSVPAFGGQSTVGSQQGGSRVMPYTHTIEAESGTGNQPAGKLLSISAMPVHKDKSHQELRWEDYQRGDKGGQRPAGQSPGGSVFNATNSQPSIFSSSQAFSQPSTNPTNPFAQKTPTTTPNFSSPFQTPTPSFSQTSTPSFSQTTTPNFSSPFQTTTPSFSQTTTPSFGQTTTPSMFGPTTSNTTSVFGSSSGFVTTPSQPFSSQPFGSAPANGSTPGFSNGGIFNNSQSSPLFSSNSSFRQNTTPAFAQTGSGFAQNTNPALGQSNLFSTPSNGFANLSSSSPSLTTSISPFSQTTPTPGWTGYPSAQPTQPSGALGQTQIANTIGFSGGMGSFSQGNFTQGPALGNSAIMQPNPVTNPFGTLPALPQISIAQGGNSPSIQYGISSMPVVDKPAPVRVSPLLTSRHLLQRRVRLPSRKYRPGDDGPKVPFFSDEVENSSTPKADAFFIPRENPRALFIRPVERVKSEHPNGGGPTPLQENGTKSNGVANGANHENDKHNCETRDAPPVKANQKTNGTHENHGGNTKGSHSSPNGADIESLMPKLHHSEYFTEPRIQELAAKERVDPGYCRRVKEFVIGRHGYGSIKFLGETDVCRLDLEMLVQFNTREVVVYMDESKKPPVGQGLNKPAIVTLLNIKCMDKKTGTQVKEGARVDKYKEMLKRKAEEQGAEFVSYDAVNGEWAFKVEHFSSYKLGAEDDV